MGKRPFAFFDVDNTVISIKSMFSFQSFWYDRFGTDGKTAFESEMSALRSSNAPREQLNRRYYRHFAGRDVSTVEACAAQWFKWLIETEPAFYHRNVLRVLKEHQKVGEEVVFISGSFPAALLPIANDLGVEHVLSTTMEVKNGKYTGEILPPQTIGAGKKDAIVSFLKVAATPAQICYGYGDDISDIHMLTAIGKPTAVTGDPELLKHAEASGWPILAPF